MKIMYRLIILSCIQLFLCNASSGQYYSYKQLVQYADEAYDRGNYLDAMVHYKKAEEQNTLDTDAIYNYATAAYETYSLNKAEELYNLYLEQAEDATMSHEIRYRLAKINLLKGDYQGAIMDFDLYMSEYAEVDSILTKEVNFLKSSAEWAVKQPQSSTYESFIQMDGVNSPYSEHAPYDLEDEIYYSSLRYPDDEEELGFKSRIFRDAETISIAGLSESNLVSHPSFSPDGNLMFFTIGEFVDAGRIRCDIYFSRKDDAGNFISAVKLPPSINSPGVTSTHPQVSLNKDGKQILIYISDRAAGKGGLDLWMSEIDDDLNFSSPTNLLSLNTDKDEYSPFHHEESETLYFSSNGRYGFGDIDVYNVAFDGVVKGEVENTGYNVNSSNNDLYFFLTPDSKQAYLSSNRPGSLYLDDSFETCCYDIYKAPAKLCVIDLELATLDMDTKEGIESVNLTFVDEETDEIVVQIFSDSMVSTIELPCDKSIVVRAEKSGYEPAELLLGKLSGMPGQTNLLQKTVELKALDYLLRLEIIEDPSGKPLTNTDVYLTRVSDKQVVSKLNNLSHVLEFEIEPNTRYTIEVNKEGYKEGYIEFETGVTDNIVDRVASLRILDVVEKALISLENAIPVSMYFDNDEPDGGTMNTTSTQNYTQTYHKYYARKDKFKNIYISKFSGDNRIVANQDIESFFENDIKRGFDRYENFKKQLLLVLENGQEANIYLRGYASPVAASDYNTALGRRRIDSVRKEFYQWRSGIFLQYIQSGQLKITERSFGETTSPKNVSDNVNAPAQSIYSPDASRERRVEIDEIQFNQN